MKWKEKGTVTVEAAFIGVFAVLAAGILLSLCLYVYQRCWYTQCACEIAMTAAGKGIRESVDSRTIAEEKWGTMQSGCYPIPRNLEAQISAGKAKVSVKIQGITPVWGRNTMKFLVSAEQRITDPKAFVRRAAALLEE